MNEELGCCTVSQRGRETGTAPRGTASAGGRRCVHACARVPARLWLTSPGSGVKAGVSPPACHLQLGQQAHSDDVLYLVASNRASKRNCCLILKGSSRFPSASLLFFFFFSAACTPPCTPVCRTHRTSAFLHMHTYLQLSGLEKSQWSRASDLCVCPT